MSCLQKGIEMVTKATEEDKKKNYGEARILYERGVEYFLQAIKYEAQSEEAKKSIRNKSVQYLERAEKLKNYLEGTKNNRKYRSNGSDSDDDAEEREIANLLEDVLVLEKRDIKLCDVAGLKRAKEVLEEAVFLPIKFPDLYNDKRKPFKGILLFGPPGCGKSFLAKALATEATSSTFFSVSSLKLVSKYEKDGEKLVKKLFEKGRQNRPSIIFFDDIDSIFTTSSSASNESQFNRRIIAELLTQMEGVENYADIVVIAATNVPWVLDDAFLKRFKKINIPLPDEEARIEILKSNLKDISNELGEWDFKFLGRRIEGFSGADISAMAQDVLMQPLRKVQAATHFQKVRGFSPTNSFNVIDDLLEPCSPSISGAIEMSWTEVPKDKLKEPKITRADVELSLSYTKPTVKDTYLYKQERWIDDYGS